MSDKTEIIFDRVVSDDPREFTFSITIKVGEDGFIDGLRVASDYPHLAALEPLEALIETSRVARLVLDELDLSIAHIEKD